ncbi:MAG: ABC transporter permease [Chloroflexota bacterium]|nr:ABC transporter permease [Chloroflexota bacterium]
MMGRSVQEVARPQAVARVGRVLGELLKQTLTFIRRKPLGGVGLIVVLLIVAMAVVPGVFATHDPLDADFDAVLKGPRSVHWLGTDNLGRDMYSRIVWGSRVAIIVSFGAIAVGTTIGLVAGVVSGYFGRWVDVAMQRLIEIMLAFPALILALALMAVFGAGLDKVVIALTVVYAPRTARVMRGATLQVKAMMYVDAARAIGASHARIMFRHLLPNVMASYLIVASTLLGAAILTEASLSFLGLGVPPPAPSWGQMLSGNAQEIALTAPWTAIFPGLAIVVLVFAFNAVGDALRDVWDPKLRGR